MLKVENVNLFYGDTHALRNVSIGVNEGEIVAVLGANGAGKTTLLKTIVGLVKPRTGSVKFLDEDITKLKPFEVVRKGVSLCPAGRQVFANMTVLENLRLGAFFRKDDVAIENDMARVFELFPQLEPRREQLAGSLSGGEQQMLAIGRALMSRPRLLMVDELSMGLAPVIATKLVNTIVDVAKSGMTILLVEQNARIALRVADRVYVLTTGEVVLQGKPQDSMLEEQIVMAYIGGEKSRGGD